MLDRWVGSLPASYEATKRPADHVTGGKRPLDYPTIPPGLQLPHRTAAVDCPALQHDVAVAAAVDIGDRVTAPKGLHGHKFAAPERAGGIIGEITAGS